MGKLAMMAVAAFAIAGSYYSLNRHQSMIDAEGQVADHQYEVVARQGALRGYNLARQALSESFSGHDPITGYYEGAQYTASVTRTGATADVTASAMVTGADGQDVPYTIQATFVEELAPLPVDPPDFLDFAILSDKNLNLNGNITGEIIIAGSISSELNANMHTNANLHITGNSVSVAGFGTFTGSGTSNPSSALFNSFAPNYNPTESPTAYSAEAVAIPAFDMAAYTSAIVVDQVTSGNVTLNGANDFGGTREDPYIWHIAGDLTFNGNSTLDGYVILMVDGSVDVGGNLYMGDSGYSGPEESSIGLYASGSVDVAGNAEIHAQIFAGGDLNLMHGTPNIYGSVVSIGDLTISGNPTVVYRPASPGLTTIWQPRDRMVKMTSYFER